MWHVALESWHWISQVAAPCSVAGGSGMTCHWIRHKDRHIGILHLVSISTTSPQLTCHSAPVSNIWSKSDHPRQISAILDFRDPIIGSLESPCATSYRSSMDTAALNCLVFEKTAFFCILVQTDRTDALSHSRYRERRLNNPKLLAPLIESIHVDLMMLTF